MQFRLPVFFAVFFLILVDSGTVFSQLVPQIVNNDADTVRYCSDSVLVAPQIYIMNVEIDEPEEGMKISIANYKRGEDLLTYTAHAGFEYRWDENYGVLEIRGIATAGAYQAAVRDVWYKNIAAVPDLETRSFSISLLDADYLPQTQHFYKYIKTRGIKWTEARDSAANMNYYGLKGYLATITSREENDFIWSKIDGVGWIGANDSLAEGTWKWVTGPEAGTVFWEGNYNGYKINGEFSYWNTGEPNNVQKSWGEDEDYAHINSNPNTIPKSWNDLSNEGDKGNPGGYYYPEGFIVEFGGMPGDPEVKLSATATVTVEKIVFSTIREYEICEGSVQQLNMEAPEIYSYSWRPEEDLSSLVIANPDASPNTDKNYRVTGTLGYCVDSADFFVHVNPAPAHDWTGDTTICKGAGVVLDPGIHTSYEWDNLQTSRTITVFDEGNYGVKLANEFGCYSYDSIEVKWSVRPVLDYEGLESLVCGKKEQKLNISFAEGSADIRLSPLNTGASVIDESSLDPLIQVTNYGEYSFKMELEDQYHCEFLDTLHIAFHNQPSAQFQIDSAECEGYNLILYYKGSTFEDADFEWFSNDTLFEAGINLDSMIIPLGFATTNRSVGLKINEKGCQDSLRLPVTVTPVLDFWSVNPEGCTPLAVKFDYSATELVDSFFWDFGDGGLSEKVSPVHEYVNEGIADESFDVSLKIVSAEGCSNEGVLKDTVIVHPVPTIDLNYKENVCYSDTMEVFYVGSGNERDLYNWDLRDFKEDEIIQNPEHFSGPLIAHRNSAPTVNVGLQIVSEYGCASDTIIRKIKRKPLFGYSLFPEEGCPPLETTFSAVLTDESDDVEFLWSLGDGTLAAGETIRYEYDDPDRKYDIQLIAKSLHTGCADTVTMIEAIRIFPVPHAGFEADPVSVLISNPVVQFTNSSEGATAYEWDFGDSSLISEETEPSHSFTEMGFYDVGLSAYNDFGCMDSDSSQIVVAFDKVFPPNAFSPNALNEEDRIFRIFSAGIAETGYKLLIFNRWGEVIFESDSQEKGWDGKMKNDKNAPAGTYTWVLLYMDFRGEAHKQQGTVTLLF